MSIRRKAERLYKELTKINWVDASENYNDDIQYLENLIAEYGYEVAKTIAE